MFDMVDIGHGQIMLFKKHPSEKDVKDFSEISKIELGLLYFHKQILFTFRTDKTKCMDICYAPQLSQVVTMEELHDYPEPEGELAINLLLLDSVTGEVKGIQVLSTDLKFHKAFAKAVRDKMETSYSRIEDMAELKATYGPGFELEKKIPIGEPPKEHKFDIVNSDKRIVIECKCYTWTETGNVPSAKMGFTNEAAFYLSFLPDTFEKYIVMLRSHHEKRSESLAEYYFRMNRHLIGKTKVVEFDHDNKELWIIGKIDK